MWRLLQPVGQRPTRVQHVPFGDVTGLVGVSIGERGHQRLMLVQCVVLVLGEHREEVRGDHPDGLTNLRHQPSRMGSPVNLSMEVPIRSDDRAFAGVGLDVGGQRAQALDAVVGDPFGGPGGGLTGQHAQNREALSITSSGLMPITVMPLRGATQLIGLPEAQLTLAHATIYLATGPKSNDVTTALGAAMADIKTGKAGLVPPHLRDGHYSGAAALGNAQGYKYSHDDPDGVVPQQYPPDDLVGVDYYRPTGHGAEREIAMRLDKLRAIIRRPRGDD